MTFVDGNPGPGLRQAQKCGRVKYIANFFVKANKILSLFDEGYSRNVSCTLN